MTDSVAIYEMALRSDIQTASALLVTSQSVNKLLSHEVFWRSWLANYLTCVVPARDGDSNLSQDHFVITLDGMTGWRKIACRVSKSGPKMLLLDRRCSIVKLGLDYGLDPSADRSKCLVDAARHNRTHVVKLLLRDRRADPTAQHSIVLITACVKGRTSVAKLLLEDRRADPTTFNNMALKCVIANEVTEDAIQIVELLLNDGRVDPSLNNSVILESVIASNSTELLTLFIKDGRVDINVANGHLLLHTYFNSCPNRRDSILKLLLEANQADPAIHNTVLIMACNNHYTSLLKSLLDYGKTTRVCKSRALAIVQERWFYDMAALLTDNLNSTVSEV